MRIGYLQYKPEYLAVSENLGTVGRMIEGCAVDLLVLPEFFASGYFFKSQGDVESVAEEVPDGVTCSAVREWARSLGATIVAGLPERSEGRLYNSAVVVTASGLQALYRKIHLYYKEKLYFEPGDLGFPTVDIPLGETWYRLGTMVCFDWRFPESARTLAMKGCDIIAHPANLVRKNCPRAMPVRALENGVFTVTANRTGIESAYGEDLTFIGRSLICDNTGETLIQAGATETALHIVEIDPFQARNKQLTPYNDIWKDRLPTCYEM